MSRLALSVLTLTALACSRSGVQTASPAAGTDGSWRMVYHEADGQPLPFGPVDSATRLVIRDTSWTFREGTTEVAVAVVPGRPRSKLRTVDLRTVSGEYKGKESKGIWETRDDTLVVNWSMFDSGKPRPTAFRTAKGSGYLVEKYLRAD